jgi:two-component system nitrate/nitrite response regulator NarL
MENMSKDSNPPISVLLIDDHILVRQGLRMLIENNPDIKVVGEAGTCAKALEVASEKLPDIVLLDLDLGGDSGLNIIPQLVSLHEKMHVLILTGVREPELHRRAIRLGAVGIIMKENAGEVLVKAIRRVHAGEVWIDRGTTAVLFQEMRRGSEIQRLDTEAARIASLTPREKEVVALYK